jgi:hypothetical protein
MTVSQEQIEVMKGHLSALESAAMDPTSQDDVRLQTKVLAAAIRAMIETLEKFETPESRYWPLVMPWVNAMIRKLEANNYKGDGWCEDSPESLLCRVQEELHDLQRAVYAGASDRLVRHEAADVANMAHMVADAYAAAEAAKEVADG